MSTPERKDLAAENAELRAQLEEAQETLRAIQSGEVDALVMGEEVYTLKGAETPYRLLIEAMNEGAATLAADGTILYCNWRFAEMVAAPVEQVIGSCLWERAVPAQQPIVRSLMATARHASARAELTFNVPGGPGLPVLLSLRPIQQGSDTVGVVAADLTERKRAEEALQQAHVALEQRVRERTAELQQASAGLRESETKVAAAFASMSEAIFIADGGGRLTTFNDEFVRYHRFKDRDECSRTIADCPKYLEAYFADGTPAPPEQWAMARALRGETASNVEYRLRRKENGETWWGSYNFAPIKDRDGGIAGAVVSARETTAFKAAEAALRERDERFTTLLANLQTGVALVDERGQFVLWNDSFLRIFGLSSEAANVNSQDWGRWQVFAEHGELLPLDEHPVRKAALSGKPVRDQLVRLKRPSDGQELWLLVSAEPILKSDGRLHQMICTYYDVSEGKRAEEALHKTEERLRLALEAAELGTWDLDLTTGIAAHSPRHDQIFGYTEAQPEWTPDIALRHVLPEDRPIVQEAHTCPDKAGGFSIEVRVRQPDGAMHWVNSRGRFHYDSGGRPVRIVGVVADITERKRTEEALRQRTEEALRLGEEEFRSLAEAMPQIVWATRADGWNIYFNQQWVDYTGMTMEESYGHGWNTPFHPDDKPRAWEAWQRATKYSERYSLECRLRRADGVYRWWLIRGQPMRGANGEILKWFGTCTDIEEIKRAEVALQEDHDLLEHRVAERTAELRESEERFRGLVEQTPDGIFVANAQGRYLDVNTAGARLLGYTPEEICRMGLTDVLAPEETARLPESVARLADGEVVCNEWRFKRKDGSFFIGEVLGRQLPDGRLQGILRDITARKQAEARLKHSLLEKEVLLKEIHHRVKNNLQVISSLVELQSNSIEDPLLRGLFQDVRDRVRSMALVHEKLYQSESLAGVEFADYARSLIGFLMRAHRPAETTVRLKLDLEPVSLPVETAVPCGLILNELITNAFKHAFRGRSQGEVMTTLRGGPDGRVSLCVSDDGVGLPAGIDWRKSRSLGLRLIHLLAGQLDASVEVKTGIGTEFLINFAQRQPAQAGEQKHG